MRKNILDYLSYDPETGDFHWVDKLPKSRVKLGSLAGSKNAQGYLKINFQGSFYLAHRLAFLFMGEEVPLVVDHINRDPADNRWCNLRSACSERNSYNRSAQKGTLTGLKGVSWNNAKGRWSSRISFKGKRILLGYFDCEQEAYRAYVEASRELHKEFSIF